jgi:hypothetical protein
MTILSPPVSRPRIVVIEMNVISDLWVADRDMSGKFAKLHRQDTATGAILRGETAAGLSCPSGAVIRLLCMFAQSAT